MSFTESFKMEKGLSARVIKQEEDELISELGDRPFYATVDDSNEDYKNKHDFQALTLQTGEKPALGQLITTCVAERQSEHVLFEQGMWVEYRSNDMIWKVGRVNRVIKQPPDDWDFDEEGADPPEEKLIISYNVGVEGTVQEDNIRAPAAGLQVIFGKRPWLWQQFALLQLEKRLRFDLDHEYDFEEVDIFKFAAARYESWMEADENSDFKKLHDQQSDVTQKLLRTHLLTPFDLCDFIVERKDEWNFNDPDISVYTYTAALGSGLITLITIMSVQILIPLVLLYNNIYLSDGAISPRFFVFEKDGEENVVRSINGNFLPDTDFETFCGTDEGDGFRIEGKILIAAVIIIYILSVVPDSALSFFRTSGGYRSTYSKINSLRNIVWEQNDDDIVQEIGFKVDRMMNTGYLCILYVVMVFILLNTPLVLDLILNALAIEFIHKIDEVIADADWWDEDNRWIKAGTIELVIQGTLQLRVLESVAKICKEYDIDRKEYINAVGGQHSLHSKGLASRDDKDRKYMTNKEVIFDKVAEEAEAAQDDFVLTEYRKIPIQFGVLDYVLTFCGRKKGVFERYLDFRVWSRWEKVLFLPKVPSPDYDIEQIKKGAANVILGKNDFREFSEHVIGVLTFVELFGTVRISLQSGNYTRVPVKVLIGIMEWVLYIATILFPCIIILALFFVPYCY